MNPTERQRRREYRDVPGFETVHRFLVRVEAHELSVIGNVKLVAVTFKTPVTAFNVVGENIRHGYKFHRAARGTQRIIGSARAAATATDQGNLDETAARRMDPG